jgi:hypothetical protein
LVSTCATGANTLANALGHAYRLGIVMMAGQSPPAPAAISAIFVTEQQGRGPLRGPLLRKIRTGDALSDPLREPDVLVREPAEFVPGEIPHSGAG